MTEQATPAQYTITCVKARGTVMGHVPCAGYVAPLQYGATRLCACSCHVPNEELGTDPLAPRDYARAEREASDSFYQGRQDASPVNPVTGTVAYSTALEWCARRSS